MWIISRYYQENLQRATRYELRNEGFAPSAVDAFLASQQEPTDDMRRAAATVAAQTGERIPTQPPQESDTVRSETVAGSSSPAVAAPYAAALVADSKRMEWLNARGRWITSDARDSTKSWHEDRKTVHFYVNGTYTKVNGDTARAAIDLAMEVYEHRR